MDEAVEAAEVVAHGAVDDEGKAGLHKWENP